MCIVGCMGIVGAVGEIVAGDNIVVGVVSVDMLAVDVLCICVVCESVSFWVEHAALHSNMQMAKKMELCLQSLFM